MSKFLKGTLILLTAGLITRILGFINRIAIARFIGEEGVGLYMMAYPTFILAVTLTQVGLPVAIAKRVAEAEVTGNSAKVKKILVISLLITGSLSIVFTPMLFFGAPFIVDTFFTDSRVMYPLITIAPVIPIIAVSSVLRGYFQGKQNMRPAAVSQIIEQSIRIILIGVLATIFLPYGIHFAAAAVMVATIGGELVSLIYLMTMFKLKKAFPFRRNLFKSFKNGKPIFSELMSIGMPTLGSRMIGSVSWFFEPIIVTQALAIAGVAAVNATKQYGSLTGFAMPLLLLPSFVTIALSTSLVPAISEAHTLQNYSLVEKRLQQAIKFCVSTGAIAIIVLYVLADPLMELLYNSSNGAIFIQIMAPFFVFQYLQAPLQAALQALDLARAAMINSLIGSVVKSILIFVLASRPEFGINGVALGLIIGFVLVAFLHYATILKVIPLTFYARFYFKILAITIGTGWIGTELYKILTLSSPMLVSVLLTILMMGVAYVCLLILFKVMEFNDLKRFISSITKRH